MPINEVHARIGNAALWFMLIAGVWGVYRGLRKQPVDGNYFGVLVVGELLLAAQFLLGLYLWFGLNLHVALGRPFMHFFYGVLTLIALPAFYAFTQGRAEGSKEQLLYGIFTLFLAGLIWRATFTAAVG